MRNLTGSNSAFKNHFNNSILENQQNVGNMHTPKSLHRPGMHGRGSQASAPASDTAGHGDAGGTPQTARPCRVVPRGNSRIGPTRPKSGRLGPYRPVSAEIQKKKKKVQNAPYDLT